MARRKLIEQREAAQRSLGQLDPLFEVEVHLETAAAMRFADAEQAAAAGDSARAAQSYERVVSLFPTSRASAAARDRLAQVQAN